MYEWHGWATIRSTASVNYFDDDPSEAAALAARDLSGADYIGTVFVNGKLIERPGDQPAEASNPLPAVAEENVAQAA